METIVNPTPAPVLTFYCCNICKTKPDQLSHHKAHLTTQKHIFRKKCFENCINTSFFNIYNLNKNKCDNFLKTKTKIDEFEKDTGLKFVKGERSSHDAIRDWHISRDCLLQEEFPDTVIPLVMNFDTEDNYKNSVIKMIDLNETLTVRNEDLDPLNNDEIKNIVRNIENYDYDFFVNMAIKTPEPYVFALIMYKQNYQTIYLKHNERNIVHQKSNRPMRFKDKCWAYKDINNNGDSNEIANNLRKTISTSVSDIFTQKIEETCIHIKYGELSDIIHKLRKTMFKNDIMKKLESLFRL
jgi:hypothetical protein